MSDEAEPFILRDEHDYRRALDDMALIDNALAEACAERDELIDEITARYRPSIAAHTAAANRIAAAIREYEMDHLLGPEPEPSTGGRWSAEVADLAQLVAAAYRDEQYLALLGANQSAINKLARKDKSFLRIPGVKPVKVVASKATMAIMETSSEGEKEFDW